MQNVGEKWNGKTKGKKAAKKIKKRRERKEDDHVEVLIWGQLSGRQPERMVILNGLVVNRFFVSCSFSLLLFSTRISFFSSIFSSNNKLSQIITFRELQVKCLDCGITLAQAWFYSAKNSIKYWVKIIVVMREVVQKWTIFLFVFCAGPLSLNTSKIFFCYVYNTYFNKTKTNGVWTNCKSKFLFK